MLLEAFWDPSLRWTVVLNGIYVSRPVECQLKVTNVQGAKHQKYARKWWKNSKSNPWRPLLNNPWAHRLCWDQLRSLPEDINR
jgi:hypothetical protein